MKTITLLAILFSLIFVASCKKELQIPNTMITINQTVKDLDITLSGTIVTENTTLASAQIQWGDLTLTNLTASEFAKFSKTHRYADAGDYRVVIETKDNLGNVVSDSLSITTQLPETSLAGIKLTMYKTSDNEILILTINLHTYQETEAKRKLNVVADVIGKMDVDFVAFQECAQHKSSPLTEGIIRTDNMALIIANLLKTKYQADYNYTWNWAHYGWDVWEEGVAVLSKHARTDFESRYISVSNSTTNLESRRVIYGAYSVANFGQLNFYSTHTHWRSSETSQEQNNQIKNIQAMVSEKEQIAGTTDLLSIVCGDFNCNPTDAAPWNEGYLTMTANGTFHDSFHEIYPAANAKPAQSQYFTIGGQITGRIDYIFVKNGTNFSIEDSQIIFKTDVAGKVPDHYGVLTKIKLL